MWIYWFHLNIQIHWPKVFHRVPFLLFLFWFCRDRSAAPCFSPIVRSFLPFSFLSSLLMFINFIIPFKESNFWFPDLFYCVFIFFIIHFFTHSFILIIVFLLLLGKAKVLLIAFYGGNLGNRFLAFSLNTGFHCILRAFIYIFINFHLVQSIFFSIDFFNI